MPCHELYRMIHVPPTAAYFAASSKEPVRKGPVGL